jgi:hypothetical protein
MAAVHDQIKFDQKYLTKMFDRERRGMLSNLMKYFPRIKIVVDRTGPIYLVRFGKI